MTKRHWRVSERIAYHEAGHAVAAHHYGRVVSEITIIPDVDTQTQGATFISRRKKSAHEILLEQLGIANMSNVKEDLTILMAGIEAVKLIRKNVDLEKWMEAKDDILKGYDVAAANGYQDEHDRHFALASASIEAGRILKGKRKVLDALATALLANESLSGQEVAQLIASNLK